MLMMILSIVCAGRWLGEIIMYVPHQAQVFFSVSPSHSCVDLFVPDPPACVRHAPKCVCPLHPTPICHKRVGQASQSVVWSHKATSLKAVQMEGRKKRSSAMRMCLKLWSESVMQMYID